MVIFHTETCTEIQLCRVSISQLSWLCCAIHLTGYMFIVIDTCLFFAQRLRSLLTVKSHINFQKQYDFFNCSKRVSTVHPSSSVVMK